MYFKELQILGLTKNEALVYDVLLQHKSVGAGIIIRETKLHRNIVYENLDKLIERGIVSYILEGKKRIYQAEPLHILVDLFKKAQGDLEKKQKLAEDLKKRIENAQSLEKFQEATIFRGTKGIQTVMDITLEQKTDYIVLGAPQQSVEIMPKTFWENYNVKIQKENVKVRMIFNDSLRDWSKNIKNKMNDIRFLPKRFDSLTETNICGDYVFIFIWSNPPLVISIRDKNLAEGYKQYFEALWDIAQK